MGSGPETIVWAHGFGTDQTAWHRQLDSFRSSHSNLLFDHVGSGRSDWSAYSVKRYTSLYAFANDVIEILEAFEIRDCMFVGHSVSGMVGLLASLLAPELFRQIIAISASPRYLKDEGYPGVFTPADLDQMFEVAKDNYAAWATGFAPEIAQNRNWPEIAEHFAENLMGMRPDIALSMLRTILESDYRVELPHILRPTVFLQTLNDPAVPIEVGQYLQRNVKGSHYQELEAEGHLPHLSSPDQVTAAIERALQLRVESHR